MGSTSSIITLITTLFAGVRSLASAHALCVEQAKAKGVAPWSLPSVPASWAAWEQADKAAHEYVCMTCPAAYQMAWEHAMRTVDDYKDDYEYYYDQALAYDEEPPEWECPSEHDLFLEKLVELIAKGVE